jgi:hypothetical protein
MAHACHAISSISAARCPASMAAARAIRVSAVVSIALISSLLLPTGCRA